jgi:ribonuclease P protein component
MDEGLKPRERIRKKKDFLFLYQKGYRIRGKYFNLIYHENDLGYSRLGIVVNRKIGKAVVRNKIKRWVRELFRRNKNLIPLPVDMLVVATRGIEGVSWSDFREEYFRTLSRIGRREKGN